MATLVLNGFVGYFNWQITGLSSAFNTTEGYVEAGITTYQFTVGGVTSISGIVMTTAAGSTRTLTSTPVVTVSPYTPGTYTFWGFTKIQDGTYWPAGSATVTVTAAEEDPTWTLSTYAWGTISELDYASYSFSTYQLKRSSMKFETSGTATFYSTGNVDTIAYLSTTTGYDDSTGVPTSYLVSDDDSGSESNFSITYNVTAGTTYYLWVRLYDGSETGSVYVYVNPPVVQNAKCYIFNGSTWVSATPYIFNGSQWEKAEPDIYSSGWK